MSELSVGALSGLAANSYVIDVASGSSLDLSNGATLPAGSIIAVKHALKTGTQATGGITAGANTTVTDMTLTHTLASASNKLLITAYFGLASNSFGQGNVGIAVADNGTLIGMPDSPGSRAAVTAGGPVSSGTSTLLTSSPSMHLLYSPGDTASHTYTVRAVNVRADTRTLYINRSAQDDDNGSNPRSVSGITIQEVVA